MTEITLTKENFQNEVAESPVPVLVDFWAEWCAPCRMLAPVIAEIAEEYGDKIKVGKVNVDTEPELAAAFNVESIPMVLVCKNGVVTDASIGYVSKEELVKKLEGN